MKPSGKLARFGVTMEAELLGRFDDWVAGLGLPSRSRALRDIVREKLMLDEWKLGDSVTAATINLVYDHHTRETTEALIDTQHSFLDIILGTTHIHLDSQRCFEVIILRGRGQRIRQIAQELGKIRGVLHCTITPAASGEGVKMAHSHG